MINQMLPGAAIRQCCQLVPLIMWVAPTTKTFMETSDWAMIHGVNLFCFFKKGILRTIQNEWSLSRELLRRIVKMDDLEAPPWTGNLHLTSFNYGIIWYPQECWTLIHLISLDHIGSIFFSDSSLRSSCANHQHDHHVATVGIVRDNCVP